MNERYIAWFILAIMIATILSFYIISEFNDLNSFMDYCKANGYEGIKGRRCYKEVLSESGIGYEIVNSGVIKPEAYNE